MLRYRTIVFTIMSVLFLSGCGSIHTTDSKSSYRSSSPHSTPRNTPTLTNATWNSVQSNPKSYVGSSINVKGQWLQVIPNSSPKMDLVYLNPKNMTGAIAVENSQSRIRSHSYVDISGRIVGVNQFRNVFGAKISIPVIKATKMVTVSRNTFFAPTVGTVSSVAPQTQNGLTIAVSKVEFANKQTRVFLTATNHSGSGVQISDNSATLVQGTHQLNVHLFASDSHLFPTSITNGVISSDELTYQGANLNSHHALILRISVSSNNFNQTWRHFSFTIPLPGSSSNTSSSPSQSIANASTTSTTPTIPLLSSLFGGNSVGTGDMILPTKPTPILVAWSAPYTTGIGSLKAFMVRGGHWVPIFRKTGLYLIEHAKIGPQGPSGQQTILLKALSGGSSGGGIFYNGMATSTTFNIVKQVQGVNPQWATHGLEKFSTNIYQPIWIGSQFTVHTLGLAATIPSGTKTINWSISRHHININSSSSSFVVSSGQSIAFVPTSSGQRSNPKILGPFLSQSHAESALANGSMSMAQSVAGFLITPPPGLSYWVLSSWRPGSNYPQFGEVIAITAR